MTVWMLHLKLTPEEEAAIAARSRLALPIADMPDLSQLHSQADCARMLRALHPDLPPESLARKIEQSWKIYSEMQKEDIIAVPLPSRKEIALAEISGPYEYGVGAHGADVHSVPVIWHEKRVPFRALAKYPKLQDGGGMHEVEDASARTAIRDRLPHSYNRFAGVKWLVILFIGWNAVRYFIEMYRR